MKKTALPNLNSLRLPTFVAMGVLWLALLAPASALDLGIESEADYQAALNGVRAAEYVRQRYLEGEAVPRALVTSTALWVFAERNPLASAEQLAEFVARFDFQMANALPGDPDLISNGAVFAALNTARIADSMVLEGTDTRVGRRALMLLGMNIDGLASYEQSRQRMSRFDLASVQRLIHRRETADMLTALLAGRTAAGEAREMLAETANAYLATQGLDPMLGQIDSAMVEVNAGLNDLPDYAGFIDLRDTFDAHLPLEDAVLADIDEIQGQAEDLLAAIGSPEPALGQILDSLELTRAAADPSHPDHAQALADIEARRVAIVQSLRDVTAQRSAIFARTLLLQQSQFAEVRSIATSSRSFAALQLQTNNHLAVAKESFGIVGSLAGVAAGFKTGDMWGTVQSITDVITGALGLADLFGSGPSAEEQIFEQIVALRQQVEDMRVQLNARFDVVDAKLDEVFSTMVSSFLHIGNQIGDLQEDVDALAAEISKVRSSLDRIEEALFGFAENVLLFALSLETDVVLNYFANNGVSLPYDQSSPSFVGASSFFYTFATSTAKGQIFAGTPDDQTLALTLDNADEKLASGAISRHLNDLRRVPTGLLAGGPITAGRVAAPAPWSQGATAYLQLAAENPWYFNFQLSSQIASGGLTRIDEIIEDGNRIIGLADGIRSNSALFDALLDRATQGVENLQSVLLSWVRNSLPPRYSNNDGSVYVDPWGPVLQQVSSLPHVAATRVNVVDPGGFTTVLDTLDFGNPLHQGWEVAAGPALSAIYPEGVTRSEIIERNALMFLLGESEGQQKDIDIYVDKRFISGSFPSASQFRAYLTNHQQSPYTTTRLVEFRIEIFTVVSPVWPFFGWVRLPAAPFPFVETYKDQLTNALEGQLSSALTDAQLLGRAFPTGSVLMLDSQGNVVTVPTRIVAIVDITFPAHRTDLTALTFEPQTQYLAGLLAGERSDLRAQFLTELANTPGLAVAEALLRLDNDAALLDAYLTVGMADALTLSEALRSGVRGAPGIAGLGFGRGDVAQLVVHEELNDDGSIGGIPGIGLTTLSQTLQLRIQALAGEIELAAGSSAPSFPYVEMILAELRALRDQAVLLAIDDTYQINGPLNVPASQGLMANDIGQLGTINANELRVDMAFFQSPEAIQPSHGELVVQDDGSFNYVPDSGYNGIDRFSYRLKARVGGAGPNADAFSRPAVVVLRVADDSFGDVIFRDGFD